MTVKRFVAPTMRRALDLVRLEMGPDAIILSSQKTKEGVEIITSSEVDLPTRGAHANKEFSQRFDSDVDSPLVSDQAWRSQQGIDEAARGYVKPQPSTTRSDQLAIEIEAARERMIAAKKGQTPERKVKQSDILGAVPARQPLAPQQQESHSLQAEEACAPSITAPKLEQPPSPPQQSSIYQSPAPTQPIPEIVPPVSPALNVDRQMAGLQEQVHQLVAAEEQKKSREGDSELSGLKSDIADMRMMMEQQMMRAREVNNSSQVHSMFPSPVTEALHEHLSGLGLPINMVKKVASTVRSGQRLNQSWRQALAVLSKQIKVDASDKVNKGGVFAFVGPTGVGKTTTIAKLAARYVLEHGMGKVALITTDTYRVGAHDQLRSLGRILNVPVRVVDQERSLASVVASLKAFPLVLIDTAGFRQGDPLLKQQNEMLESCPSLNRVLVLACNAQVQTLKASAHAFNNNNLTGCILTKLDECGSLGEMLGVLIQKRLPVMYVADGQSIPNDLERGSAPNLVAKAVALMKGEQLQAKVAVGHP